MSIETPFDPDQARIDALTEGSGRSTFVAREQVTSSDDSLESGETNTVHSTRKRIARSLGRATVTGPGGGDISRMIANQEAIDNPQTAEGRTANLRSTGHANFLIEKERLAYQHALDKAGDDPLARRVMLRKLAEDKK